MTIGKEERKVSRTEMLISQFHASAILMAGTAGGLDRTRLKLYDVVVSDYIICNSHLTHSSAVCLDSGKWIDCKNSLFYSFLNLHQQKKQDFKFKVLYGGIQTCNYFVENAPVTNKNNYSDYGTILCVEQESFGVASMCTKLYTPFLIIKGISDFADTPLAKLKRKDFLRAANNASFCIFELISCLIS